MSVLFSPHEAKYIIERGREISHQKTIVWLTCFLKLHALHPKDVGQHQDVAN